MQEVKDVNKVVREALRIGGKVIIGFPNFAFYRARLRLFFRGKTPITSSLPYRWYNTPNLHFLSLTDFLDYCTEEKIKIKKKFYLGKSREVRILVLP